ncbi:hypothetical protein GR28A_00165 [Vibrio phage vB_VcorM_GR28A]|nr:hypothetical protein GR28A_00165 [Vibrio phage vB_VcorM_GR28A]
MLVDSLDIPVGGCIPSALPKVFLEGARGSLFYPDNYVLIASGSVITISNPKSDFDGVTINVQDARTLAGTTDDFVANVAGEALTSENKVFAKLKKTDMPTAKFNIDGFDGSTDSVSVTENLRWGSQTLSAAIEDWSYSDSSSIDSNQRYWSGDGTITGDRGTTASGSGYSFLMSNDDSKYQYDKFEHGHTYVIDHYHQLEFTDTDDILAANVALDLSYGTAEADQTMIELQLEYKEIQPCWLLRIY